MEGVSVVDEVADGMLTVCFEGGMFFIGKLFPGSRKLVNPRFFLLIEDNTKISMPMIPGLPVVIDLGSGVSTYAVSPLDKPLIDLYFKVTAPKRNPNPEQGH